MAKYHRYNFWLAAAYLIICSLFAIRARSQGVALRATNGIGANASLYTNPASGNKSMSVNGTISSLNDSSGLWFTPDTTYGTPKMYDSFGALSEAWTERWLLDDTGTSISLDWSARQLHDGDQAAALDWDNRLLIGSGAVYPAIGPTVLDWSGVNGYSMGIFGTVTGGGQTLILQTNGPIIIGNQNKQGLTVASTGILYGNGQGLSNLTVNSSIFSPFPQPGWSNRLALSVNTLNCGSVGNQAIFVNLYSNRVDFTKVNPSGYDFQFYDSDGITPLVNYRNSFTSTNGQWIVVIPRLAGTGAHPIVVDYGNGSISTDTISSTNALTLTPNLKNATLARWLFNETTGTNGIDYSDALSNATVAEYFCSQQSSGGPFLNGQYLHLNTTGYCVVTNAFAVQNFAPYDYTVAAWVRFPVIPAGSFFWIVQKDLNGNSDYISLGVGSGTGSPFFFGFSEGGNQGLFAGQATVTNVWHRVVGTVSYDESRIYVDGVLAGTGVGSGGTSYNQSSGHPLVIGADNRSGTIVSNNTPMDIGPTTIEYSLWTPAQVSYDYNFAGRSVPTTEQDKWQRQGIMTGQGFTNAWGFSETTRLLSSRDNKWKLFNTGVGGANGVVWMAQSNERDKGWSVVSNVIGNGVGGVLGGLYAAHGFAADDGNGTIYWYWTTNGNPFDVWYVTSTNGGFTFKSPKKIQVGQYMNGFNSSANNQGNISVSHLTAGPMAGRWIILQENQVVSNPANFQTFAFWGTNWFGTFLPFNGGWPVAFFQANAVNTSTNTFNDPGGVFWANGRYQAWGQILANRSSTSRIVRYSTLDFVNWQMEPYSGLALQDANYAATQVGDNRNPLFGGGICDIGYGAINGNIGLAGFSQQSYTNSINSYVHATFNGSIEQLVTPGSVFVSDYATNSLNIGSVGESFAITGPTSIGVQSLVLSNPIASGGFWTNLTGVNGYVTVNGTLTDSAVSGDPSMNITNVATGEFFNATNSFTIGGTSAYRTILKVLPLEYVIATNLSSGSASATVDNSWFRPAQ